MAKGIDLTVDNLSKIPSLEKALNSGRINIILVFAEWCGACHKFRNNIWNPMMRKNALHNRISVRDDMIKNSSLANTSFDYLPSILVVDEKGVTQTFHTPEGKITNAMPTPKNLDDMTRIVNVPVSEEQIQRGGSLLSTLESATQGVIPATVLGSLVLALRGGRRKTRSKRKIDRRTRKR